MIQTPILDTALQTNVVKDIAPSQQPAKKPSGASSTLKDRLESQRDSQSLSIVDLFIGDEGAYEIAKFLKQNKEYTSIQLRGNNISAAGFETICQALKGFNRLRDITAEWNNIGSDISGLVALHQVLKTSNSVETVDLKNNRLGPNCGRVVGDIIRDSNSLKKIDLRWNELGNEGGQAILKALQESSKTITVDLSGNKIHEETLSQIDSVNSNKPSRQGIETSKTSTVTQKTVYGQQTPSVESKVTGIQTRFSNSAFPTKYGSSVNNEQTATFNASSSTYGRLVDTKQESVANSEVPRKASQSGSAYRPATPTKEGNLQTLSVNTNSRISERPITQDTRKYSYLADRKTYNAPNDDYGSPSRRRELGNMMDDVAERIDITNKNIERYSPQHKSKENFRYDTASRTNYEVKQDITRRSTQGHDLTSTYKYRQVQMTPSVADIKHDLHATSTLRRSVNVRQEADEGNLKVGKLISDLERALEKEQLRAIEAEARFNALANDYEMEQILRQELEKKHSHLIEELRRRDLEVNELRIVLDDFEKDNIALKADVDRLARENDRLDEFNKVGLSQIEEKYISQLKHADSQNHSLRLQLEEIQHELNGQVMSLRRELDDRCRNYEEQILEFSKMNDELSNELSSQLEFIDKLKIEHQEHLNRTVAQAREEEVAKAQVVIRDLEAQITTLRNANESLAAKNAEMLADLQGYEKQIREQHIQFANELARLGAELDRLRAELNQAHVVIQKQDSELVARDGIIHQLKGDVDRLRVEMQRLAEEHARQIENLKRDFENERRRFGDNERQLIVNIEELEKRLIESQNETVIITREYDRLVEIIKGNVTKAIHDTFVTHKNTSEIRHIEHRTTAVNRPLYK